MSWMVIKTLLSSTDPITEQEDRCSLDEENERFSRNLFDKTCSNEHTLLKYMSWMVIKKLLSSTDPITEQEDRCNLDEENERFSENLLYKTCSK